LFTIVYPGLSQFFFISPNYIKMQWKYIKSLSSNPTFTSKLKYIIQFLLPNILEFLLQRGLLAFLLYCMTPFIKLLYFHSFKMNMIFEQSVMKQNKNNVHLTATDITKYILYHLKFYRTHIKFKTMCQSYAF
jgi:hypothetical protein